MSLFDRLQSPRRPLSSGMRRVLQALLLVGGAGLLVISSAFLLTGLQDDGSPASAAALQNEWGGTLDVGAAFAGMDAEALNEALDQLMDDLRPTPTPRPSATPTPTPPPSPKPTAVPVTAPAAPAQPIAARHDAPAVPPAPPPTPTSPPPPPAPACPTAGMAGFGLALFNAVNSERTQNGMPALAAHGCVVYVAQLRSNDMASRGYFSHTSPEGETAFTLLDSYGVPHGWAGENLARNNYPDDQTVGVAIRDLMASEGHRANILSGNYTQMGVAVAFDGAGMKYYTMIFIGPP